MEIIRYHHEQDLSNVLGKYDDSKKTNTNDATFVMRTPLYYARLESNKGDSSEEIIRDECNIIIFPDALHYLISCWTLYENMTHALSPALWQKRFQHHFAIVSTVEKVEKMLSKTLKEFRYVKALSRNVKYFQDQDIKSETPPVPGYHKPKSYEIEREFRFAFKKKNKCYDRDGKGFIASLMFYVNPVDYIDKIIFFEWLDKDISKAKAKLYYTDPKRKIRTFKCDENQKLIEL